MRICAVVCALLILVPAVAHAGSAVPAAPSEVDIDLVSGRITWTDNSTDEDGFRVTYAISLHSGTPRTVELNADANVTAVTITDRNLLQGGDLVEITVVAFNANGDSAPGRLGRSIGDQPAPQATAPTPRPAGTPRALPSTGSGSENDWPASTAASALALALTLLAAGVTLRRRA